MRARLFALLLLGVIGMLAVVLTASASARTTGLHARTLTVHVSSAVTGSMAGPIGGIALDGTQAAYVAGVRITAACGLGERVYRWNLATGRTSLVSGAKTCARSRTGRGIAEVALAGSRAAWVVNGGGNTESFETLLSSTAKPDTDKVLATSDRLSSGDNTGPFAGTWIGGLVSDGSQISYATWSTEADQTVTKSALWRISGSTAKKIATGSGAVVAASADGGRIALLRTDATVAVYGSGGNLLTTIPGAGAAGCIPTCPGEAVALTGRLVAVLASFRPWIGADSVEVYDRTNGELLHTWPAGGLAWQFDAYDGIAVYAKGARVHALDLQTGKDVVVANRTHTIQGVRFDRGGLLYYFNLSWSAKHGQDGKLVFVPFKTIAAKLGR
jgi:hypothetical protein